MTDFLSATACRGRKPKHIASGGCHLRADLHAKLARHRHSIRFIIAPALFGKTSLAAGYADKEFSFNRVHWINGRSPCFIRDLNKGTMSARLLAKEEHALAVFDDMPHLDSERERLAVDMLEELVAAGWEVIVVMEPGSEAFGQSREGSLCIRAHDLLLSDPEIDTCRSERQIARRSAASFSQEERIPGLFWASELDHGLMLRSMMEAPIADEALLALFVLVVLRQGSLDEVGLFADSFEKCAPAFFCEYLYLGIDVQARRFEGHVFPVDAIAKAFSPCLDGLASVSAFPDRAALVAGLADALLTRGDGERACKVIAMMCSSPQRASWLYRQSERLLDAACLMPAHLVYESLNADKGQQGGLLHAAEAWRLVLLGDEAKAMRLALRLCQAAQADAYARKLSGLLVMRSGSDEQRAQASSMLRQALHKAPDQEGSSAPFSGKCPEDLQTFSTTAVQGALLMQEGFERVLGFLSSCDDAPGAQRAVTWLLSWIVRRLGDDGGTDCAAALPQELLSAYAALASNHLGDRIESGGFGFLDALLAMELESAAEVLGREVASMPARPVLSEVSHYEISLFMQRKAYQEENEFRRTKKATCRRSDQGGSREGVEPGGKPGQTQPLLRVNLFGGLEVLIGDKAADPKLFSRQKVKALLALLVLHQGKELPRERLCRLLWPDSNDSTAQHNLYSIWSLLRKALAAPDGSCPYLIRTQFSYKADSDLVSSDVADLARLCRTLQFGQVQGREWPSVFALLNDRYAGDLLPTEMKNEAIIYARKELKSRLVDALAAATLRQYEAKDLQTALLLARSVLVRDASREDVYTLLMQTQIALGQRTAALDTFFRCRKYLSDQLGIDPSSKTHALYLGILEEEPRLLSDESRGGTS